jgi:transcriptional regulator with XRE-family HTH domain
MSQHGQGDSGTEQQRSIGAVVRRARRRRYWTQSRLAAQMQIVARQMGWTVPKTESLVASISRWVCDERRPDYYSRLLLRSALGLSNGDLQLPND